MTDLLKMIHSMKSLYDHLCMDVMQAYHLTRSELDILLFLHNNPEFDSAKDIVEKEGWSNHMLQWELRSSYKRVI